MPSTIVRLAGFAMLFCLASIAAAGEEFTDAIHAFLQQVVEPREKIGIVVGIVDEHGASIVACGRSDDATGQEVTCDTVFEIGSDTKTFTALLLQDMVQRGQMKLDDPVATYLPNSVKMPSRNGKEITLRHLATHRSGLPSVPDNLNPRRADNPYAEYTVEKLYAFLSSYQLTRDPGAKSEYSNLGMGLLGHVIGLKAQASYESLVLDRICRPLQMDSTRITLTPELNSRFVTGHNPFGEPVPSWDIPALPGAGALRSTAHDMLKYVSANLGLPPSSLTPLMEKTHDLGLAWYNATDREGTTIIFHGGGTGGCRSFTGFDKARRRGVVVLSNSKGVIDLADLGNFILKCEWQSNRRPLASKIRREDYDAYVGQYQRAAGQTSPAAAMWQSLFSVPKAAIYSLAFCGLVVIGVGIWRAGNSRKRAMISCGAALFIAAAVAVATLMSNETSDTSAETGIGIRREGDRIFAAAKGPRSWPMDVLLPPSAAELLPESETRFFERLSGNRITFSRAPEGNVTRLTAYQGGDAFVYEKTTAQPPVAAEPLRPRVAVIVDTELLDALVGDYEFAPSAVYPAGTKVQIWREADQLLWQERGQNAVPGAIELFPESPLSFFTKIDQARLTFSKNANGEVTAVNLSIPASPEVKGTKIASN